MATRSQLSALSPVDPSTLTEAEQEKKALWITRKLGGSIIGRTALSIHDTLRSGANIVCLSPWGDASPVMLPCVRFRDLMIHSAIAATGGTAAFAAPLLGPTADLVVGTLGDSLAVEVGVVVTWDVGHKVATDLIFDGAAKVLGPEHRKLLTSTEGKVLTVTMKYQHHNLTDATLSFFRASSVVHDDSSLFATIGDWISTQKGWFCPYLNASARRPAIPRNLSPDVIYSHGPFMQADYALAKRLAAESAIVVNLSSSSPPSTPPIASTPPVISISPATSDPTDEVPPPLRNFLITVVGIAPHRFGMWTSSARPGESVIKYTLLNGCPALILPVLPGSPLIAWHTLTLEAIHKQLLGELDLKSGDVKEGSEKFRKTVDTLFEFLSLCVDWSRIQLPAEEPIESGQQSNEDAATRDVVKSAVALILEGAVRSGLPISQKGLKDLDLSRAGIAMWRMP